MNFYGIKELRMDTRAVLGAVAQDGKAVITDNGKPKAIMVSVSERDFDEVYLLCARLMAQRAAEALQRNASPMTPEEIEAEISAARRGE